MTVELYRTAPDGSPVKTLAQWKRGDHLDEWMDRYIELLKSRDCERFTPERAIVCWPSGRMQQKWTATS